ncbi:hypothetical protein [Pseudomonas putida]|jgi:hypothetical protein|uniref:hypothetical protein n=1 Tax=Pseudomonas putida TaxID=303 RepID=UPI000980DEA5|nr:hypothetical protein [Pseudomonas putida]OMQ37162.1 hypothetical protein BKX96_11775 [Pseudomonas putida]
MVVLENLRVWLSRNLAPVIFLVAYFFTVVLGNIIYWLPFGRALLERDGYTARILGFETLFTPGYWLLLALPFLLTPVLVFVIKKMFGGMISRLAEYVADFSIAEYLFIISVAYAFVVYSLVKADAFSLFLAGTDAVSSVLARFQIRDQLGFAPLAVLMSVLHYLSIYSLVRWMKGKGKFWLFATVANAALMSLFLTMLNMKWPILIFYAGLVLAIFVYAKKYAYFKTIIGGVLLILMYFLISAFVFRLAAPSQMVENTPAQAESKLPSVQTDSKAPTDSSMGSASNKTQVARDSGVIENVVNVGGAAAYNAPMLMFNVVNRMAIIYPYYYQVFTKEGAVCGGVLAQARIGQPCRPSTYIYGRIFDDQFKGRGTAPAAVQITAYALGGWPLAVIGLLCASIVLAVFASLPLGASATIGSLAITGAIAGYHFSQLPGEGPIFYDHGVFWTLLVLILFGVWRAVSHRLGSRKHDLKVQ